MAGKQANIENISYNYSDIQPITGEFKDIAFVAGVGMVDLLSVKIHLDLSLLLPAFMQLPASSLRIYIVLLKRLERNDMPVFLQPSDIKQELGHKQQSTDMFTAARELERFRLIIREKGKYNYYWINPLFAWVGERTDYIDSSTVPFMARMPNVTLAE